MNHVQLFVRHVMQTPWCLGVMGFLLVFVPILGMWNLSINMDGSIGNLSERNMYREEHLQKKSDECAKLWYEWEKLWRKRLLGAPDARKDWCKCCDEFSIMVTDEVKKNPRYQGIRMFPSHESNPPPTE